MTVKKKISKVENLVIGSGKTFSGQIRLLFLIFLTEDPTVSDRYADGLVVCGNVFAVCARSRIAVKSNDKRFGINFAPSSDNTVSATKRDGSTRRRDFVIGPESTNNFSHVRHLMPPFRRRARRTSCRILICRRFVPAPEKNNTRHFH